MGDESPIFARMALGVRSPSVSPPPLIDDGGFGREPEAAAGAGDDWKKRGEDAGGCEERGPRRGVALLRLPRREAGEDIVVRKCDAVDEYESSMK